MITLADISSLVEFNEEMHTYNRKSDGKPLSGVTTMLRSMGLSANYDGIPEEVLKRAADRGHEIHRMCDMVDALDCECDCAEANAYLSMRRERGLIPITSEYLISDMENIASSIDLVLTTEELQKENKVILADIKCTSSIHHEPLGWQLSIYRELFERQNPDIKVAGIIGIWLPKPIYGSPKIFDAISRTPEDVDKLISCFVLGVPFSTEETSIAKTSTDVTPLQNNLIFILRKMDELKKKEAELKEQMLLYMKENGYKKFDNEEISITFVPGATTQRFDSSAFKKDNPEMYAKYVKTTETSDSIRIKIK